MGRGSYWHISTAFAIVLVTSWGQPRSEHEAPTFRPEGGSHEILLEPRRLDPLELMKLQCWPTGQVP